MIENSILASGLAAVISRTIMHPIDTLRIRYQVGEKSLENSSKPQKGLSVYRGQLRGLYSGYSVALLFTLPGMTIFYTSYDINKKVLDKYFNIDQNNSLNHSISGFLSSNLAGLIFNPMEVIKGYLQVQGNDSQQVKVNKLIQQIYRKQGMVGFQNGYFLSVAVFGPHNLIYFSFYEKFKKYFNDNNNNDSLNFVKASALSTLLAVTSTHPIEVLRSKYQYLKTEQNFGTSKNKVNISNLIKSIYKNNGIRGFYKGMLLRCFYFIPNTTMTMTLFELFKIKLMDFNKI
ncbi:mitochondrial carrier [Neoconidiobolus thromboides FSU 785]|nr:mitochondrial carrier [Neoconidiobolus thromboides FSU 785]